MAKYLVIVESPAKMKTLQKFLGKDYAFESSVGHIRDLPQKDFGVDVDNNFEPTYVTMSDKKEVISKLKKAAKGCEMIYLAPDPDREGEAIAWHISEILPEGIPYKRVAFNSITKEEVQRALNKPTNINMSLVNAQQARRILDRLVGYSISPILNRRIQRGRERGVSAGRVQSVALKLVVDREREIEAFNPVEYWNLGANLDRQGQAFTANLFSVDGKKVEKEPIEGKDVYLIGDQATADNLKNKLEKADYKVTRVEKKERKRHPVPPFITSTLQQEASRHYGYSSSRTMSIAQSLYEGSDGTEGLITYMRTDSVRTSEPAIQAARGFVKGEYGDKYLPSTPKVYSSKKSAQDAHEAIRPTNLKNTPEKVKNFLTIDQYKLYVLIWRRFISSHMVPAIYDTVSADVTADTMVLRATGSILKFNGFLAVYEEKQDEASTDNQDKLLPPLEEGETPKLLEVLSEQAFTRPPPRFSEASLVKELEKLGIGRPSTYAAIMSKIQSRDYTVKESGRLKPTEIGTVIADLLEANFNQIMNVDFTANMEDALELIADSDKEWRSLVADFWKEFAPTIEAAKEGAFIPKVLTDRECPKCDSKLQKVWFRDKYFYGCTKYPDCDFTAPIEQLDFDKSKYADDFEWEQACPKCEAAMKLRFGKYGPFLGCTTYPDCRGLVQIPLKGEKILSEEEMPDCPAIDCPGKIMARRSRFGKIFYSCSTYPDCNVIVNDVEQLETKYPDHPRTPYEKKARGKKKTTAKKKAPAKKRAPQKPVKLSKELAEIVGANEMARPEVLKKVWDYIKANNLQDPKNKRNILPDAKLGVVFGTTEVVPMTQVMGKLKGHVGI